MQLLGPLFRTKTGKHESIPTQFATASYPTAHENIHALTIAIRRFKKAFNNALLRFTMSINFNSPIRNCLFGENIVKIRPHSGGFDAPRRGEVCDAGSPEYWNVGIVEYWEVITQNREMNVLQNGLMRFETHHSTIPLFQYSKEHIFPAEPIVSDLVQRARISTSH